MHCAVTVERTQKKTGQDINKRTGAHESERNGQRKNKNDRTDCLLTTPFFAVVFVEPFWLFEIDAIPANTHIHTPSIFVEERN